MPIAEWTQSCDSGSHSAGTGSSNPLPPAVSLGGMPGHDRKVACLAYPTSAIPLGGKKGGLHPPYACLVAGMPDLIVRVACLAFLTSRNSDGGKMADYIRRSMLAITTSRQGAPDDDWTSF